MFEHINVVYWQSLSTHYVLDIPSIKCT